MIEVTTHRKAKRLVNSARSVHMSKEIKHFGLAIFWFVSHEKPLPSNLNFAVFYDIKKTKIFAIISEIVEIVRKEKLHDSLLIIPHHQNDFGLKFFDIWICLFPAVHLIFLNNFPNLPNDKSHRPFLSVCSKVSKHICQIVLSMKMDADPFQECFVN